MRRKLAVGALAGALLFAGAAPASATANPRASCVGIIASQLAPAGQFDVTEFKALAEALGAPNFGQFVSVGAQEHFGTLEACVPPGP